ncbi:hypothetical protein GO013_10520 [Pseudodesulfovibrio sp. JC047]|uniref:hypothetical protein n=1 Tax=Pseudodesulfovibrio sp. JC047 TaxID=2683199 RepID=UPI0013D33A2A|nr:hypothetical protein [Pseudodesulfovibrio sp. JC047]NDV19854.1 hypothetical protein [Pseudodesulfovibrio sp. JC047]
MLTDFLHYDKNDYKLLEILDDLLTREVDRSNFKTLLEPYLKPHGIKELAAERGLRIAYAIMHLLQSLKSDQASDRTKALIALRDETMSAASGGMRNNRARVLLQIGKELIRARGNREKQLELAHEFRRAALGKTRFIRQQLKKYHLLEMPEEWNQVTFDDRVHDANSKGRKSATHLIMDAWIKGIRRLTVVYYDFMEQSVARELFASAQILGITVSVGIEYKARFGDRFIKIVWGPDALQNDPDINGFFNQEAVQELMQQGREIQTHRTKYVQAATEAFNDIHRKSIQQEFGIELPHIDYKDVAKTIGTGQPSIFHLGNHIHEVALPLFIDRVEELKAEYSKSDYDTRASIAMHLESLDSLDSDTIIARYLVPEENPKIPNPDSPATDGSDPELLKLSPAALTYRLRKVSHTSQLTLILSELDLSDAIEVLYDCKGRISHFEVFNSKSLTEFIVRQRKPFSLLQKSLNEQNAVTLKRTIRQCIEQITEEDTPQATDRAKRLMAILSDFSALLNQYKRTPLRTKIGSGSTGRSTRSHGMGFAVVDTLPFRTQQEIRKRSTTNCIPVSGIASQSIEFIPPRNRLVRSMSLAKALCHMPGLRGLTCATRHRWHIARYQVDKEGCGNVVSLGGMNQEGNGLSLYEDEKSPHHPSTGTFNTSLKNAAKILIGFIPAFLTFALTKDWWVLAYLGGVIWFSITGLRNVIQSILGGGGLRRSPYLRWNDYIDWERISDSLLYTGFSVPLLDWLCKSVLLDQGLGITTATNPLLLYTIMAITNGVYISSHNIIRGLPRKAAIGNFFRSILSIPVAMFFNAAIGAMLFAAGASDIPGILQLWAAVISKLASDCAAGVIEGLADRGRNIAMRHWDYSEKIRQIIEIFSQLEIEFPTRDMLKTLNSPKEFIRLSDEAKSSHTPEVIANALDLLYIRTYKPRAREALREALEAMNRDELEVFMASQQILSEEKTIARLFVDGLVGRNFPKALAFYLLRYPEYLRELDSLATTYRTRPDI